MNLKKSFEKKDTLAVKGAAILLLLFYHLFESQALIEEMQVNIGPMPQKWFLMLSGYGNICVALFVFLTAYGITKGLEANQNSQLVDILRESSHRCGKLIINFAVMYLAVNLVWFSYFNYKGLYGEGWQGGMFALIDGLGFAQLLQAPTLNMTWWYMELAIILIFLVPFLTLAGRKTGNYLVILGFLFPLVVTINGDVARYLPTAVFGVAAAQGEWFEKLFAFGARQKALKVLAGIVLIAVSILFRQNYMVHTYFLWIADAPIAVLLAWFVGEALNCIPGISHVLRFLGKHSMNIFFVHTFFYMSVHRVFIYSFRHAALIYVVLLAVSLGFSVVLETVKWLLKNILGKILHSKKKIHSL